MVTVPDVADFFSGVAFAVAAVVGGMFAGLLGVAVMLALVKASVKRISLMFAPVGGGRDEVPYEESYEAYLDYAADAREYQGRRVSLKDWHRERDEAYEYRKRRYHSEDGSRRPRSRKKYGGRRSDW